MSQFRKKPVVVEARQLNNDSMWDIWAWIGADATEWCWDLLDMPHPERYIEIQTLEGKVKAQDGDWVIKGVKGEFYPCKPDIFALTYEEAPNGAGIQAEQPASVEPVTELELQDLARTYAFVYGQQHSYVPKDKPDPTWQAHPWVIQAMRGAIDAYAVDPDSPLRDALDHIRRVARRSRIGTRRLTWIAQRAQSALNGDNAWRELDEPKNVETDLRRWQRRALEAEAALAQATGVAVAEVINGHEFGDHGPESRVRWLLNPMPEGSILFEDGPPPVAEPVQVPDQVDIPVSANVFPGTAPPPNVVRLISRDAEGRRVTDFIECRDEQQARRLSAAIAAVSHPEPTHGAPEYASVGVIFKWNGKGEWQFSTDEHIDLDHQCITPVFALYAKQVDADRIAAYEQPEETKGGKGARSDVLAELTAEGERLGDYGTGEASTNERHEATTPPQSLQPAKRSGDELLQIAREVGLRGLMHGVSPQQATEVLLAFFARVSEPRDPELLDVPAFLRSDS